MTCDVATTLTSRSLTQPSPASGRGLASYDRPALVAHARDSMAAGSKSFAAASRLFDPVTRERAWLLYAWCRACDDLADGQQGGGALAVVDDAGARLTRIRDLTERALAGRDTGEPAFDALGLVAAECALPHRFVWDVVEGFALDAAEWSPRSEEDLYRYSYHVAGAVGCLMAVLMGVDPEDEETLDRACDLGLAFQLANIARDLCEDYVAGRCYLPAEWLAEADIPPGEHMKPAFRPALVLLARRLADRAAAYEASARIGAAHLPFRARWAVLAAAGIYGDIAREVARRGDRAWDRRVVTTKAAKLGWIAKAGVQAIEPPTDVSREGLWTRQRHKDERSPFECAIFKLKRMLIAYGLREPIDPDSPIIAGLGLDEDDFAFDLVPEIERFFEVRLDRLLDTGERAKRLMIQRLRRKPGTPIWRDPTLQELAIYVSSSPSERQGES